jgi:hypothetical protein
MFRKSTFFIPDYLLNGISEADLRRDLGFRAAVQVYNGLCMYAAIGEAYELPEWLDRSELERRFVHRVFEKARRIEAVISWYGFGKPNTCFHLGVKVFGKGNKGPGNELSHMEWILTRATGAIRQGGAFHFYLAAEKR